MRQRPANQRAGGGGAARPWVTLLAAAVGAALLPGLALAQGGFSFVGRVDRSNTTLGDPILYEVTLAIPDGQAQGYQAPDFKGFRVLGEYPSQSTQIQMGGGRSVMRTVYSWRYELSPTQSGRLTIGAARVRVGGRELKTAPVPVMVSSGALAPPGQQADPTAPAPARRRRNFRSPLDDLFGRGLDPSPPPAQAMPSPGASPNGDGSFIRAVADKKRAYVGEQVVVEWFLYLTEKQDKYQAVTEPRTDGFWSEDLVMPGVQGSLALSQQVHEGRVYLVAPLMRKALFPLQPGTLTVTPLEADISQADFFGRYVRTQRLKADPLALEVLPLPSAGRPAGFDPAAVGKLTIEAKVDRAEVAVGEAVVLTVTVSGQGNLRKLQPPRAPALDGFRAYEPKVDVKVDNTDGITGSKQVETLLLPQRPGTTSIPPLELAYFDPVERRYQVARSSPLRVVVTGDAARAGGSTPPPGQGPASLAGVENVLAAEIRPPRARASLRRDLGTTFYKSGAFLWVVAIPPLGLALTVALDRARRRLHQDSEGSRRRQARKQVRRHLRAAEAELQAGNRAGFYNELDRVLGAVLSARLGRAVAGMSRLELASQLERSGLPRDLGERAIAALEECDRGRFAPGGASADQDRAAFERAAELLDQIEKAPVRAGGPGQGAAA